MSGSKNGIWQYSYFDPTKTEQYTDIDLSAKSNYPKGISSINLARKKSPDPGYPDLESPIKREDCCLETTQIQHEDLVEP